MFVCRQRPCSPFESMSDATEWLSRPRYQSRIKATLLGIYRALQRLGPTPDTEVVIDVTDGELQNIDLPVLVITHRAAMPAGILYPDFTFFSWPESACPPEEPSHAYGHLLEGAGGGRSPPLRATRASDGSGAWALISPDPPRQRTCHVGIGGVG